MHPKYGIESGSDELCRTILAKNISTGISWKPIAVHEHGIRVIGQNMFGVGRRGNGLIDGGIEYHLLHAYQHLFFAPFPAPLNKVSRITASAAIEEIRESRAPAPSIKLREKSWIEKIGHARTCS